MIHRIVALLLLVAFVAPAFADPPSPEQIRAAANKSLALLQQSAMKYTEHRQCFSCHHQALPTLAFTTAKECGFEVDVKVIAHQLKFTADFLGKNRDNYLKGKGQGGQADTAGYALLSLAAGGWKSDATTAAVVEYLLQRDNEREYWQATSQRPPSEASSFTTTFLALSALKHYGPDSKKKAIGARTEKARKWLLSAKLKDTEDRVFQLRALKVLGAEEKLLKAAGFDLLLLQRKDGGWAQLDTLESDAYATGSVLSALYQCAGVPLSSSAYQRGIEFLLATQKDDGSWYVKSRSKPFQLYFESGFPHTKDQWISCASTSWATIALALAYVPDAPMVKYYDVPPGYASDMARSLQALHKDSRSLRVAAVGQARLFIEADAEVHARLEGEIRVLAQMMWMLGIEPRSDTK